MDEEDLKKHPHDMKDIIQVSEEDIIVWAKLNGIAYNYCPKIIKKLED